MRAAGSLTILKVEFVTEPVSPASVARILTIGVTLPLCVVYFPMVTFAPVTVTPPSAHVPIVATNERGETDVLAVIVSRVLVNVISLATIRWPYMSASVQVDPSILMPVITIVPVGGLLSRIPLMLDPAG